RIPEEAQVIRLVEVPLTVYWSTPSTTIICVTAADCRIAFAGAYTSDDHHSFAFSNDGNSITTIRPGCQSPSSRSALPPRTINFPPKGFREAGVNFLYSS